MDYSLLVALTESAPGKESASGGTAPMLQRGPNGTELAFRVSIIDILQVWTTGKKVARCLKVAEQNKATVPPVMYARRFREHFSASVRPAPEAASPPAPVAPPAGEGGAGPGPEDRAPSKTTL